MIALALAALSCGGGNTAFEYPQNGSTTVDPFKAFEWKAVSGATSYTLMVGSEPSTDDVYVESDLRSNVTSRQVWGLLPQKKYYARLAVQTGNSWSNSDIAFTTTQPENPGPSSSQQLVQEVEQLASQIRLSTQGLTNYPTQGTPLYEDILAFGETGADCSNFANTLVRLLAENGIYSRRVGLVIVDWITHVLVEYYDPFLDRWSVADATFGAVYYDDATQRGQSAAELSQFIVSQSFSLIKAKFVTPYGSRYMNAYQLDPVTMFLNVVPQGDYVPSAAINPPFQYLLPTEPGTSGCYEFQTPGGSGSLTLQDPPSGSWPAGSIVLQPWDNTGWYPTVCLNKGWSIISQPPGTALYAFRRVLF